MKKTAFQRLQMIAVTAAVLASSQVYAADSGAIEEIVVTAQKT